MHSVQTCGKEWNKKVALKEKDKGGEQVDHKKALLKPSKIKEAKPVATKDIGKSEDSSNSSVGEDLDVRKMFACYRKMKILNTDYAAFPLGKKSHMSGIPTGEPAGIFC